MPAQMTESADSVMSMEWIAMSIAVIAAIFTGWQAWEARRSRKDAQQSADDAQQHEQRAADASERIAAAIEEQNMAAHAAREKYTNPWALGTEHVKSGSGWRLRLTGSESVTGVRLTFEPEDGGIATLDEVPETMEPGEAIHIRWWKGFGSPAQAKMRLTWVRPNGDEHNAVETLH